MEKFESNIEKEPTIEKIRVSVSNLVNTCRVNETGEVHYLAMKGKPIKLDGEIYDRYQALGGAAKMTDSGKQEFIDKYNAEFGRPDRSAEEDDDARFFVPLPENAREYVGDNEDQKQESKKERDGYLHDVLDPFVNPNEENPLFETDVMREVEEELGDVIESTKGVSSTYSGIVSPVEWKTKTSARETGVPSRRLFRLFEIGVSVDQFKEMQESEKIRILSEEDLEAIRLSVKEGKPTAMTSDGGVIVENIFPEFYDKN